MAPLPRFWFDDSGATLIEYAVMAAGIALAIAAGVSKLGGSVSGLYPASWRL
jgi:Flp pilus assembly pilin Flp